MGLWGSRRNNRGGQDGLAAPAPTKPHTTPPSPRPAGRRRGHPDRRGLRPAVCGAQAASPRIGHHCAAAAAVLRGSATCLKRKLSCSSARTDALRRLALECGRREWGGERVWAWGCAWGCLRAAGHLTRRHGLRAPGPRSPSHAARAAPTVRSAPTAPGVRRVTRGCRGGAPTCIKRFSDQTGTYSSSRFISTGCE
eukprot:7248148-Prymnesium_polylepis.1